MNKNNTQSIGNPLPLRILRRTYPLLERTLPKMAHKLAFNLFFTPMRYKAPPRELPIIEKAKKYSETINKNRIQFYSWGTESDPLVVLAHGWMGRSGQFYKLIETLVERKYHVVAFDGPGHGASAGRQASVVDFAVAMQRIENKYGNIFFAVGHSFGGLSIVYAVAEGLDIKNVIFIATPSISEDIVRQFEEKINASPATGAFFLQEVKKRHGVEFKEISASELIKKVSLNSLYLVHDKRDKDVSIDHAYLMQERFPAADTYYSEGLGHTRILRNAEVIDQIVSKIDRFRT